jgi:alkylation response protein AidB-like acyl-CoA dehydrogenase
VPSILDPVPTAFAIAEELLFPNAAQIDAAEVLPRRYLDALAEAGLYGLFGPVNCGGYDADPLRAARVVEALGGASLTTAFVWIQHHSVVRAVAGAEAGLRHQWLPALCLGQVRAGIAYAALRRPGPPSAIVRPHSLAGDTDGWTLDGYAPWVTGWDRINVLLAGARAGADVVWALLDAEDAPTAEVRPVRLDALQASATVSLRWSSHVVAPERVVAVEPFDDWVRRDAAGRQLNGYLAIGVAARCARLLGPSALDASIEMARLALDTASGATIVTARAEAALLAVRAAQALVASGGGRSVESGSHAARLMREAMFLLVFGQTRDIRAAQLQALGARPSV